MHLKFQNKIPVCFFIAVLFFSSQQKSDAQQLSNFRTRSFPVKNDTLTIDTLSIIPGSVIVEEKIRNKSADSASSRIIAVEDYFVDEWKGILVWKKRPFADS